MANKSLKKSFILLASQVVTTGVFPASAAEFRLEEATISSIHRAFNSGGVTCSALTQMYIDRIKAYDQQGPTINSIVATNSNAIATANQLDIVFKSSGLTGPLHCIPAVFKDVYATVDLPTTYGSLSLSDSTPTQDAFQVSQLREAGAIILAKTNLSEFGIGTGIETTSSLGGQTVNPYALNHYPGGSSGGTGAAIAANFSVIGMGIDTTGSTRYPSAFNNLFGIRTTTGLSSRAGIIPLSFTQDIGAPMTRTVSDLAQVLDVTAGYDPNDPITAASIGKIPSSYTDFLNADSLFETRIGVVRDLFGSTQESSAVNLVIDQAIENLESLGATIVDPVTVPKLDEVSAYPSLSTFEFKFGLNDYLSTLGTDAAYETLEEIINSDEYDPNIRQTLVERQAVSPLNRNIDYITTVSERTTLAQQSILRPLDKFNLDALLYPTIQVSPPMTGNLPDSPGINGFLSAYSGFPAISVPAGFTSDGLPVGFDILGRAWSEPELLGLAYSFEQATSHRRSPNSVPSLSKKFRYTAVPETYSTINGLILCSLSIILLLKRRPFT